MSLFKGLRFLFIPNAKFGVSKVRASLAQSQGAVLCDKFVQLDEPEFTTHVLVDDKVLHNSEQVVKKLKKTGLTSRGELSVPVLKQEWLVDCVEKKTLLPVSNYYINLNESPPSDDSSRKRRRLVSPNRPSSKELQSRESPQTKESANIHQIMSPQDKVLDNPNSRTIDILAEMAEEHKLRGEIFRVKAYTNAIDTLQKSPKLISSYSDAIKLPGIGSGIASKIEEITKTSQLQQLENVRMSDESKLLKLFEGIHGVGAVTAAKWVAEGMTSLEDVSQRTDLTQNQRLGLKYYDDWNTRIPRAESTLHGDYVKHLLCNIDPDVEATIGGSYRRGSETSADIDFIVTKPNEGITGLHDIIERLWEKMEEEGYAQCRLQRRVSTILLTGCALPAEWNKQITGISKPGKCRRIDFLLVPWEERGAAMIYFTGNNEFNKKLRFRAQKRGMVLSGFGLFKVVKDLKGNEHQELVEGSDERRIMELLDVKWHEPEERDIGGYSLPWN